MIHLNSKPGPGERRVATTLPLTKARGTGPNMRESLDVGRLSPTSQQWPCGTCGRLSAL